MHYRERLWASPGIYLACALIVPAVLLVFVPISWVAGIVVAVALYAACVALLVVTAPVIEVTDDALRAGRARIPLEVLGRAERFTGEEAVLERGQRLDARAWLLIRGWIRPVVKVAVLDPLDPAPYWLLSSRHPGRLAAAINERVPIGPEGD